MALLKLRDYQQQALEAVRESKNRGITRQLIVLPTGVGKTIIMAAIACLFDTRVLLLAHREELIRQAHEKFLLYAPNMDIGICKAQKNEIDKQVVIGSVQSCIQQKRLKQLKEKNFDIMMIDEAHHAESASYQKLIQELGFNGPRRLLIGVTATPDRADKKQLSNTFDEIVFTRSIGNMIKAGHLPPVIGRQCFTMSSLKGVKSKNGDFISTQLSHAVNNPMRNKYIVDKYKEHASGRKAIAFCVDVKHTQDLAAELINQGIKAAAVWGAMPREDRIKVLSDLHTGALDIVTSCELLTEGFDEDTISAILMARPTKSKSLYIQMTGRGLRKHHTKVNCLVLDFTDTNNNLDSIISLSKAIPEATEIKETKPAQQEEKAVAETEPNLDVEKRSEVDALFGYSGRVKVALGPNWGFRNLIELR